MRFLVASPNKQFLNTVSGVFRYTVCPATWAISDIDMYDDAARRKLPDGTIWLKPSADGLACVTENDGEMVISVPGETFQSFQTALHILETTKSYRRVDWVAITPFGNPDSLTARQMRDAYIEFTHIQSELNRK